MNTSKNIIKINMFVSLSCFNKIQSMLKQDSDIITFIDENNKKNIYKFSNIYKNFEFVVLPIITKSTGMMIYGDDFSGLNGFFKIFINNKEIC